MPRYIDADAFVQAEIERCGSQPVVGTCTMDNEYLSARIAAAPTISPDEVRGAGKWIPFEPSEDGYAEHFQCSNCNTWYQMPVPNKTHDFDYCPNCGAKMEVSEDAIKNAPVVVPAERRE